ncbi:PREDICTED: uncharacterized protein LOC105363322 [Ceratosolen solmsi marchali]|uniref:Uncharacterized protein LOC105363322 n=1 Tax=Ceratosolen solmsi marchali TaxID=326594 RepID=A0AAJ7DWS4_9HYME|nr:PREDICTED: uncharacterized protein LOC105363322 [Ceratosolen solmsi marchali]
MSSLGISVEALVEVLKEIVQGLLWRRFKRKAKCYIKLDFKIFDIDDFFIVQVTKCSSGFPDLRVLFTDALKNQLSNNQDLGNTDLIVATVEEKSTPVILTRKVICTKDSTFKIATEETVKAQKEYVSLKCYVSIKLLVHTCVSFLQIEELDSNIKILFRKDKQYIYRNHVRMDDIILSCKILSSSCTCIFLNSQNDFQKELMNLLGITNPGNFEETLGCLLLAQVNNNFKGPCINKRRPK